jgi:hypothetical protein
MLEAIKQSPEAAELKSLAKKKIVGIIGDLNQRRRQKEQKQLEIAARQQAQLGGARTPQSSVVLGHYGASGYQYTNGVGGGQGNRVNGLHTGLPPSGP